MLRALILAGAVALLYALWRLQSDSDNALFSSGDGSGLDGAGDGAAAPAMAEGSDVGGLLDYYSDVYGVPRELARSQAWVESRYNPDAHSKAGAMGVLQLMPKTAAGLGVTNPFDPEQNIDAGLRYLREQFDRFGSWSLALAAYNAGPGRVVQYGGVPPFVETQNYVRDVLSGAGGGLG